MLRLLARVGDAGKEAMIRQAKIPRKKSRAPKGVTGDATANSDPNEAEMEIDEDSNSARADEIIAHFDEQADEFEEDVKVSFARIRVYLDYRLSLARDVAQTVASTGGALEAALVACAEIESASSDVLTGS